MNDTHEDSNLKTAQQILQAAEGLKALDTVLIDVRGRCSYADFLVIASGTSARHVSSIAEHIDQIMSKQGQKPLSCEGLREGQWALLDFGDVVAHIFHEYTRSIYQLEDLWQKVPAARVKESPRA
jgi:ribosome-associated protein